MGTKVRVDWDTEMDGLTLSLNEAGLSEIVEVPSDLAALLDSEDPSALTDYLSDTYGFCVLSVERI